MDTERQIVNRGKNMTLLAWCGPVAMFFCLVGIMGICGFLPPPRPSDSAEIIAARYNGGHNRILFGLFIMVIGGTLIAPFAAAITVQLKRIEGRYAPFSSIQLTLGVLNCFLFIWPAYWMAAAMFRPERAPELILLASDMAWLPFVGIWSTATIQALAIGILVLQDEEGRIFPRWVGYYNICLAVLYFGPSLIWFFKSGPFAWNGLFPFYGIAVEYGSWFFVMFFQLRKCIEKQVLDELAELQDANRRLEPRI